MTCGADLAPMTLACSQCHALVHSEELTVLSTRAQQQETEENFMAARETWAKALTLLPYESTQAEWIRTHLYRLQLAQNTTPPAGEKHKWAKWLGPLAPVAIFLAKAKWLLAILKMKFLFSFFLYFWIYLKLWGWKFGLGFALLIFVHEMGHFIDIKRRGLPAELPVFVPFLGAYVKWNALGISLRTRAAVSLAGPLAGGLGCLVCLVLWWKTGESLWAGLAWIGALMNLLNLLPVWILDGAGATNALDKSDRWWLLGACVLLAVGLHVWSFLLLAGGMGFRLATKDFPPVPSRGTLAYYIGVLVLLGGILHFVPTGFPANQG